MHISLFWTKLTWKKLQHMLVKLIFFQAFRIPTLYTFAGGIINNIKHISSYKYQFPPAWTHCISYNKSLLKRILINVCSNTLCWKIKWCSQPLVTVKSAAQDCSELSCNFFIESFSHFSWLIVCAGCDPTISKSSNPQLCLFAGSGEALRHTNPFSISAFGSKKELSLVNQSHLIQLAIHWPFCITETKNSVAFSMAKHI